MRITGGKARSIALDCPKGDWVRPATDRMREAVFSSIAGDVHGAVFLDLFAGSGSYGLEAISRGARAGFFVEQHRMALKSIDQNLARVRRSVGMDTGAAPYSVLGADVFKWLARERRADAAFDLVFIDPPYQEVEGQFHRLLEQLTPLLNGVSGAWVLLESPVLFDVFPPGYVLRKAFGKGREDSRAILLSWMPNR